MAAVLDKVKVETTAVAGGESDDEVPLALLRRGTKREKSDKEEDLRAEKKPRRAARPSGQAGVQPRGEPNRRPAVQQGSQENAQQAAEYRWWDGGEDGDGDGEVAKGVKWTTLSHNAVLFPPEYDPHGIPIKYAGKELKLECKAEEVATFYAAKLETDYVKKETFRANFFEDFRAALRGTPAHRIVKHLDDCDFGGIHALLERLKAEKKEVPAAERKAIREAEAARTKKYTVAIVDGREEKIGNFRVEPPGLFLGRGEHPKMGKVKARIYPEDITINIGEEADVPPCPIPGHKWGSIVHKRDVTWLAGWKDSITNGSKYVWLAAGSAFKGMSDHAKFEKARKLRLHIQNIRRDYRAGWKAKGKEARQRSTAMYLIDKLALRVGNDKNDEEADTVGCCSLRVEHIKFVHPKTVEFDFLGKDSIRYFNSVEVEKPVFDNLRLFCRGKAPDADIFHRLSVTGLNDYLKSLMDGLSAKVFRTFNASQTLDRLLRETPPGADLNAKLVFYNQQNKEVAILCNHQRALPKAHGSQMEKMDRKVSETKAWLAELKRGKKKLIEAGCEGQIELTQMVPEKPNFTEGMSETERSAERKRASEARNAVVRKKNIVQIDTALKSVREKIAKLEADMLVKEDLKTVALGTSKINYLDPRITVAWCKRHEVPIERIFPKTLMTKFAWAMEASQSFEF